MQGALGAQSVPMNPEVGTSRLHRVASECIDMTKELSDQLDRLSLNLIGEGAPTPAPSQDGSALSPSLEAKLLQLRNNLIQAHSTISRLLARD